MSNRSCRRQQCVHCNNMQQQLAVERSNSLEGMREDTRDRPHDVALIYLEKLKLELLWLRKQIVSSRLD